MNITKLPSGSYRIRQMVDGQNHTFTLDHKPTKAEITKLISDSINNKTITIRSTMSKASRSYIEAKSNVLSPATIRGYNSIIKLYSPGFASTELSAIGLPAIQTEINRISKDHSPKTVRNFNGFVYSVLLFYGIELKSPKLPQKKPSTAYIPTKEEVHRIFDALKGDQYEIPILLSAMGLRRSEICALTIDDLNGNILTVNKALVLSPEKKWVQKTTKTEDSTRQVVLPDYLAELIREKGEIYNNHPGNICKHLHSVQKKLGIPEFALHKMRHFFASYMHDLGYSDKQIQAAGGWKTDNVMKTVYQHAMEMEEAKKMMAKNISDLL